MLGKLTGQQQTDGGLDLATSDSRALVVVGKWVHLLENFVNVDAITLPPSSSMAMPMLGVE